MTIEANRSTSVTIGGKEYAYFGGTNYLGLSHRPELMQAAERAFKLFGFSAGASRLTSGENTALLALEQKLAKFARAEAALVLPAGFMSNQAVVDGIDDIVDCWVIDAQAHGSIKSAVSLSRKPVVVDDYSQLNGQSLRERHRLPDECTLGVFAEPINPLMGTVFEAGQLVRSMSAQDYLVLDEAHSFGVLGDTGIGALEDFGLQVQHLVRTGTFSKAIGTYGGFVLAESEIIEHIKNKSGTHRVSTALSPIAAAATTVALDLLHSDPSSTLGRLRQNVRTMNAVLEAVKTSDFANNVVPIYYLRNSEQVSRLRDKLPERGIFMPTITSYFAGNSAIGLRWTIQAGHSNEQLQHLADVLQSFLQHG